MNIVNIAKYTCRIDGLQNVVCESSNRASFTFFGPLLVLGMVELITPKPLHQTSLSNLKLADVHLGKVFQGEGPAVKSRSKADSAVLRVDLFIKEKPITTML